MPQPGSTKSEATQETEYDTEYPFTQEKKYVGRFECKNKISESLWQVIHALWR